MKRLLSLVAVVLLAQLPLMAQVNLGVKGGYNITQMSFSKDVIQSSNRNGFFIGPVLRASLPMGLGVDLAALYDQREAKMEGETVKQKNFNLPLNVRYDFGLGNVLGFYLAAGPQASFNIGKDKYSLNGIVNGDAKEEVKSYSLRSSNFSVNLGGGFRVTEHLEVGCVYNIAIGKTGDIKDINLKDELSKTHAHAWQLSAALFF